MDLEPLKDVKSKNTGTIVEDRFTNYNWFAKRYLLAVILCLGSFSISAMGKGTSIALIEMTKNRTIEINGTMQYYEPEFDWNSKTKGLILGIYAYGALLAFFTQWVVNKFGGVTCYGVTLLFSGIINVHYPFLVRLSFPFFLSMRITEGMMENFAYLSTFEIWSKWAPNNERSKLMAIQLTGPSISGVIIYPLCGYLAYIWQWPSIFHFTGGIAIIVSSTMLLLFSNEPSTDKYMLEKERVLLMQKVETPQPNKVLYPWKQIITSVPLWALFILRFACLSGSIFISICLPHYVKDVTNKDIREVGVLSAIPNSLNIITLPLFGWFADFIQNKNRLNATQVHKLYTFIGLLLGAGCFFLIAVIKGTNFTINIILLIILALSISLGELVTKFAPLCMAPNHSSLIGSVISYNIFLGIWFIPMLMGYVVTSHDPYQWSIFLSLLGAILLIGGLTFIFLGSSEVQSWSQTNKRNRL